MLALSQNELRTWTPELNSLVITDLDECSINSDHRRNFCPDTGELDIPAWQRDSTPQLIAKDSLRPWGHRFAELVKERGYIKLGYDCDFAICTSREFTEADYAFMRSHLNMDKPEIWHRETGCNESRESLKHRLFIKHVDITVYNKVYFFDDKVKNVLEAEKLGINGILVY